MPDEKIDKSVHQPDEDNASIDPAKHKARAEQKAREDQVVKDGCFGCMFGCLPWTLTCLIVVLIALTQLI